MYIRMNITNRSTVFNNKKNNAIIVSNPTTSPPYNLTYRVPNIHNTISASQRGQYVSFCASGSIYSSSNYGSTFTHFPFNQVFTSIAISTSGQFQVATTYGIPFVAVYVSNNYGASWIEKWNTGYHDARFIEQTVISSDGAKICCLGGGFAGSANIVSLDSGNSFFSTGSITHRPFCCLFNDKVIFLNNYDQSFYSTTLSATPITETFYRAGNFSGSGNTHKIFCNSFGSIICVTNRDQNLMSVSTDSGVTFNNVPTPPIHKLHITSGIFYGASNTTLYKSVDFGSTWTILYTTPSNKTIRSMTGNISYVYMVFLSGEIVILSLSSPKTVI